MTKVLKQVFRKLFGREWSFFNAIAAAFKLFGFFLLTRFLIMLLLHADVILFHRPSFRFITFEQKVQYLGVGICPVCGYHGLENGITGIIAGYPELAMPYSRLGRTSELRVLERGLPPAPIKERLIDIDHTWACAWHYFDCLGVLRWRHLWEVDKGGTIKYWSWCLTEIYNEFIEPLIYAFTGCREAYYMSLPLDEAVAILVSVDETPSVQSGLDIFGNWLKILVVSVCTIWARGVGPRTRPDQLSDLTWGVLLLNLAGWLTFILAHSLMY